MGSYVRVPANRSPGTRRSRECDPNPGRSPPGETMIVRDRHEGVDRVEPHGLDSGSSRR